jgi:hypothetical protein
MSLEAPHALGVSGAQNEFPDEHLIAHTSIMLEIAIYYAYNDAYSAT